MLDAFSGLRLLSRFIFLPSWFFLRGYFSFNTRENTVDYDHAVITEI